MANNPLSALFAAQRHAGCTAAPKRGGSESMERDRRLFFGLFSSVFPFFPPPPFWITQQVSQHTSLLPTPVRTSGKPIVSYL